MIAQIDERFGQDWVDVLRKKENVRVAASRETALHQAADSLTPRLSLAFRSAFAAGRRALRRTRDEKQATAAIERALAQTLPRALGAVLQAGGDVAVEMLSRDAEFNPDQPRDEQGQWSSSGVAVSVSGPSITFKSEHGDLEGKIEKDTITVREAHVKTESRGRGEGVRLYNALVDYAQEKGFSLQSSHAVSVDADRVWQSLKKRGSLVERAGAVELDKSLNKFYAVKEISGIQVRSGAPIWRSTWKIRTAATKFTFSIANKRATDWAKKHAAELVSDVTETSRRRIRAAIAGLTKGEDWGEAVDIILDAVGDDDRAELIARHETMVAASEGQRQAWDQAVENGLLDENAKRTWITVGDEKVCPICEPLDGAVTTLDGEYPGGLLGPPAHVTCRCTEGISG